MEENMLFVGEVYKFGLAERWLWRKVGRSGEQKSRQTIEDLAEPKKALELNDISPCFTICLFNRSHETLAMLLIPGSHPRPTESGSLGTWACGSRHGHFHTYLPKCPLLQDMSAGFFCKHLLFSWLSLLHVGQLGRAVKLMASGVDLSQR